MTFAPPTPSPCPTCSSIRPELRRIEKCPGPYHDAPSSTTPAKTTREERARIEKVRLNLEQWLKDEAFHTIARHCGDLIRILDRVSPRHRDAAPESDEALELARGCIAFYEKCADKNQLDLWSPIQWDCLKISRALARAHPTAQSAKGPNK